MTNRARRALRTAKRLQPLRASTGVEWTVHYRGRSLSARCAQATTLSRGAVRTTPRRLNLLVWYRTLVTTAKPYRDLVRAVLSARCAHPVRIGSPTIAADVICVETTLVRHRGNQNAVAINVDVTQGRTTPEEVHRVQAVHFVTTRVQSDLHRCGCRCRRCSRRSRCCSRSRCCRRWCG